MGSSYSKGNSEEHRMFSGYVRVGRTASELRGMLDTEKVNRLQEVRLVSIKLDKKVEDWRKCGYSNNASGIHFKSEDLKKALIGT